MSRYVYEHLFLTHLHFDEQPEGDFFTLVRSKTPPGRPVDVVATRRPYDDPGIERVYYRLVREKATILTKTHLPYLMNPARMQRWQKLFIDADYELEKLPGYQVEVGANPFVAFQDLPVNSRYRFLLDDAQIFIMGFIKGSVCRGEVALTVIDERFWVFFVEPDLTGDKLRAEFLSQQSDNLRMPGEQESSASIFTWRKYAALQKKYFEAKAIAISDSLNQKVDSLKLETIWNGDNTNTNATLTVFRHFDNASVVQGLVGKPPKTAWVIDYALFERIHYLLVAGFDPFGNVGHQLMTRLYMDFMRIEGEFNFVAFLPPEYRFEEMNYWYRGADKGIRKYVEEMPDQAFFPTEVQYETTDYKREFFRQLQQYLGPVLSHKYDLTGQDISEQELSALNRLGDVSGGATSFLPEVVFIRLTGSDGGEHFYTLIHNRGFSNVTSLFDKKKNRLPDEDDLTIVPGLIGSYPNVLWDIQSADLDDLVDRVAALATETDYRKLLDLYGVRRTSAKFWNLSDRFHEAHRQFSPAEAGLFDYNRLENR